MYSKIENDFKEYEQSNVIAWMVTLISVMAFVVYVFFVWEKGMIRYFIFLSIYVSTIIASAYLRVFFYVRRHSKNKISLLNFFKFSYNVKKYKKLMHDNDIDLLKDILEENKVDTQEKRLIAIQHYQSLIPRNIKSSGTFLSILAFSVSVLALILSDNFLENMSEAILIFVLIVITCALVHVINTHMLQTFGSVELYKRLESSITEIYMSEKNTNPISQNKNRYSRKTFRKYKRN